MKNLIDFLQATAANMAKVNKMKLNGTTGEEMETAVLSAVAKVENYSFGVDLNQYHGILDDVTEEIRNPENWAVREGVRSILKEKGWRFYSNYLISPKRNLTKTN